ncbi:hypothetical protein ACROYT_G030537 [Oculina patagonica]
MMTTGDLKNNLRKLVSEVKQIHYPQSELDIKGVAQGIPKAFLPIVHYVFLDYSIALAQYFASKEYELYGKTDLRFMEAVYKVLRDEFGYKPQLTREQFLTIGFAERKIILLCAILKLLREKHDELKSKSGKSEKKKVKQSLPSSRDINGTAVKESLDKVTSTSSDHFPGPLPVDTDMKSFRSNEEAMKAGLGLKEPLVTRMFIDAEPSISTGSHEMPLNNGPSWKSSSSVNDFVPSNLIIKPTSDQRVLGVKFPVSQNSEIRSNLSRQPHAKTVTWEDQVVESQSRQSEKGEKDSCVLPLSNGTMEPISEPARIHSIPNSGTSTAYMYYPIQTGNSSSTVMIPHTIPSPVSMTTAPLPSPDLMLTPIIKNSHQAIPLSSSRNGKDLQGASPSDSKLPCTKVVRHSNLTEASDFYVAESNSSSEAQVYVLKQQIQELQEKFDSMVLLNNEMSARNEKDSVEKSPVNTPASVSPKLNGETGNCGVAHKPMQRHNSSSRKLFTDTVTSLDSDHAGKDSSDHFPPAHSEKSVGDDNDSDDEKDPSIVISPFPSVSKLSQVFANSSTKNTVVNVHKRLQETRQLLARTNRDFATRFNHFQVE